MKLIEGNLKASKLNVAIVASKFNEYITQKLLDGAIDCLMHNGVLDQNITILKVPVAFVIPLIADKLAATKKYNCIICLGAVIRGATPHFDYVAGSASTGIAQTSLKHSIPVSFGILTTDTIEQALERAGNKSDNKGWNAASTAIEMATLIQQL